MSSTSASLNPHTSCFNHKHRKVTIAMLMKEVPVHVQRLPPITYTTTEGQHCCYCFSRQHFSNGCNICKYIVERLDVVNERGLCHLCTNIHSDECAASGSCYYCRDRGRRSTMKSHHNSLCPFAFPHYPPEQARKKRNKMKECTHCKATGQVTMNPADAKKCNFCEHDI